MERPTLPVFDPLGVLEKLTEKAPLQLKDPLKQIFGGTSTPDMPYQGVSMGYHIGIIPDGNRRWAKSKGLSIHQGHEAGAEKMIMAGNWALNHPEISILTIYGLSEENYRRPEEELNWLYSTYDNTLKQLMGSDVVRNNRVKIRILSTKPSPLPSYLRTTFAKVMEATQQYNNKILNILIGYTGQSEILRTLSKMVLPPYGPLRLLGGFTTVDLETNLLVKEPCDFIIRTSYEEGPREAKSGFLLWQSAYAEYYHINKFFPDITEADLDKSWAYFKSTPRRLGDGLEEREKL